MFFPIEQEADDIDDYQDYQDGGHEHVQASIQISIYIIQNHLAILVLK